MMMNETYVTFSDYRENGYNMPDSIDYATQQLIDDWFGARYVLNKNFVRFFERALNLHYPYYQQLLRIDPSVSQYDWFVERYLERELSKAITENGTSNKTDNATTTTNVESSDTQEFDKTDTTTYASTKNTTFSGRDTSSNSGTDDLSYRGSKSVSVTGDVTRAYIGSEDNSKSGSEVMTYAGSETTEKTGSKDVAYTGSERESVNGTITRAKAGTETDTLTKSGKKITEYKGSEIDTEDGEIKHSSESYHGVELADRVNAFQRNAPQSASYNSSGTITPATGSGTLDGDTVSVNYPTDTFNRPNILNPTTSADTLNQRSELTHDKNVDETSYGSDGHTTTKSFDDRQNEESFNNYQEQNTKTFNNFNETESYSGYYKEKTFPVSRKDTETYNISDEKSFDSRTDTKSYNNFKDTKSFSNDRQDKDTYGTTETENYTNRTDNRVISGSTLTVYGKQEGVVNGGNDTTAQEGTITNSTSSETIGTTERTTEVTDEKAGSELTREIQSGRHERPAALIDEARKVIERSESWLWFYRKLDVCFLQEFEVE